MALLLADVDIFLLREPDQITDKQTTYTASQIREQLHNSAQKLNKVCRDLHLDIDSPLTISIH